MARMYLYRVRGFVRVRPDRSGAIVHGELHDTQQAWSYADMLDVLPALLRCVADADRPLSKIEIEMIDTYDGDTPPQIKEVDPRD